MGGGGVGRGVLGGRAVFGGGLGGCVLGLCLGVAGAGLVVGKQASRSVGR